MAVLRTVKCTTPTQTIPVILCDMNGDTILSVLIDVNSNTTGKIEVSGPPKAQKVLKKFEGGVPVRLLDGRNIFRKKSCTVPKTHRGTFWSLALLT